MENIEIKNLDFVLFDMIGTTVQDGNQGGSVIVQSFTEAFAMNQLSIEGVDINTQRGKSKRKAIQSIIEELHNPPDLIEKIYFDFIALLEQSIHHFSAMDSAAQIFSMLRIQGIKIGIGSGLPLAIMEGIIKHIGWKENDFDYINSSDVLGIGRPNPIMIIDAMKTLDLQDPQHVLKVGDTLVDILEGKNAGVCTAMVLTGTQTISHLGTVRPDFILESIGGLFKD